jgi:hypothetical protein
MTQTVVVAREIRCPPDKAGAFIADPHNLFATVSTFDRCRFVAERANGELWDVFLSGGTIYLGGRVLVTAANDNTLRWRSVGGVRHAFQASIEPDGPDSRLQLTLTFSTAGFGIARLSEWVARGWVARNLEAAAEEIRHHLEFET